MKRPSSSIDDETNHSSKFSKNPDSSRKLTFQINDSVKDLETQPVESKFKSHQSTPYPKKKFNLKSKMNGNEETKNDVTEKRNPEYLLKITSLNRSFMRWIDIYFNKGYNYDFTPVCNDYIRFINNLKEKYPVESDFNKENLIQNEIIPFNKENSTLNENIPYNKESSIQNENIPYNKKSSIQNDIIPYKKESLVQNEQILSTNENSIQNENIPSNYKNLIQNENIPSDNENLIRNEIFLLNNESSPMKASSYFSSPYMNTPPPNPGDKNYKSTPHPKLLLKENKKKIEDKKVYKEPSKKEIKKTEFPIKKKERKSTSPSNNNQKTIPLKVYHESKRKDALPIDTNLFDPQIRLQKPTLDDIIFPTTVVFGDQQVKINQDIKVVTNEEEYIPPKPEVATVKEDSVYSVKCKLFYKKESTYVEKGVGTLYIKETKEKSGSYQLLIRGENSLATILLNIRLKTSLPIIVTKNGLLLTCLPNPPLESVKKTDSETATFYIKVKTNEIRNELCGKLKKYSS